MNNFLLEEERIQIEKAKQNPEKFGTGKDPLYIDGTTVPDTPERQACDELGIVRYCCRKHLLTHRDLIEKI
jgi:hypothetical protein